MLFYCGNQWGYTPVGKQLNIPTGFCNPPTGLTSAIYGQYATLTWDAPHDYIKFVLEYKLVASPTWTAVDVFGQSAVLTLTPLQAYQWRVKTICQVTPLRESLYAQSSFITGPGVAGCSAVTSVSVSYQGTFYSLTWLPTGASYYTLEVRIKGTATPRTYITQNTFFNLTGLAEGVTYEARVLATCQDITMVPQPSPWVEWTAASLDCPMPGNINYTKSSQTIIASWGSAGLGYTYTIILNNAVIITNYPGTTWTFNALTPGTPYTIKVITNCSNGTSDPQILNVTTDPAPCNPPTALTTSLPTPTGFSINWTPGPGIASQQVILNNGTPIALGAAINTYVFTNLPAGSNNSVVVRSVCTGNVSPDVTVSLQLAGCAAVTGLVLTPHANSIDATWNPVANAVKYRVSAVKISDSSTAYAATVFSTFAVFPLLLPLTDYLISVTTECAEGLLATPTTTTGTTTAIPNCENAVIDTTTIGQTTLDFVYHFASGRTTGFITAELRLVSTNALVAHQEFTTVQPISFTGLTAATAYKILIYNQDAYNSPNCTPTPITNVTTTAVCAPPTNVLATLISADTQIQVSLTASVSAPPFYQLEFMAYGDAAWTSMGAIPAGSFPTNIGPVAPGKYKVRVRSNCPASVSTWVESPYACPTPVVATPSPIPGGIHLAWGALVGINVYSIDLTAQMTGATKHYSSNTNSIDITDLVPGSVYSGIVKAICDEVAGTGKDSLAFQFTTGAAIGERPLACPPPQFTAYIQDCNVTDPGGSGGGGGGGGPEVPGGCAVTAQDWTLINALFADVSDDAPNDTFLEATFEISQSIPIGATAAMPGGIMGVINAACLPASTASVGIEVVLGGALQVGNGTYATNGNITVAGSYLSDGSSRLVIRLRGNYNKV